MSLVLGIIGALAALAFRLLLCILPYLLITAAVGIICGLLGCSGDDFSDSPRGSSRNSSDIRSDLESLAMASEIIENSKNQNRGQYRRGNEGFFDGKGCYRKPGEGYFDGKGYYRKPGEGFFDGKGYYRKPGEGFFDGSGIYRKNGEGYFDGK